MFFVVKQQNVSASVAETWTFLAEPQKMGLWFADVDRMGEGEPFKFEFGDGDFFSGRVTRMRHPDLIELLWKFMGLGRQFRIQFLLSPLTPSTTAVTVVDYGALTLEEAASLREGWEDFLGRLAKAVDSRSSARYRWSETIAMGAVLEGLKGEMPSELRDPAWWRSRFAGIRVRSVESGTDSLALTFYDPAVGVESTQAKVKVRERDLETHLSVAHSGWDAVAEDHQLAQRRRYAALWLTALRGLEGDYAP